MINKKTFVVCMALCVAFILKAQDNQGNVGNIFAKTSINFDPSAHPDGLNVIDSIIYIQNS